MIAVSRDSSCVRDCDHSADGTKGKIASCHLPSSSLIVKLGGVKVRDMSAKSVLPPATAVSMTLPPMPLPLSTEVVSAAINLNLSLRRRRCESGDVNVCW